VQPESTLSNRRAVAAGAVPSAGPSDSFREASVREASVRERMRADLPV